MPRYDYKCLACKTSYEITHKITEEPEILCPKDNSICRRQISQNVMFETPVDVEWEKDPSDLTVTSYKKYSEAKKRKFRW
jgi:putative FmdB family regulatory protein